MKDSYLFYGEGASRPSLILFQVLKDLKHSSRRIEQYLMDQWHAVANRLRISNYLCLILDGVRKCCIYLQGVLVKERSRKWIFVLV